MNTETLINISYIFATFCFILGLKKLGSPATARKGNLLSSFGMLVAILATLLDHEIIHYNYILMAMGAGTVVGFLAARLVGMTSMPEMVALLNGFGGIASLLVGHGAYAYTPELTVFSAVTIIFSVIIGGMTFTGSLLAWAKLKGIIGGKPLLFPGQKFLNAALVGAIFYWGYQYSLNTAAHMDVFMMLVGISLLLGILTVIPIGGADMPVVISLLNSFLRSCGL